MMSSASTSAAVAAEQRFDDALEKYLEEIVDPNNVTSKEIVDHDDKKEDKHYDLKRKREEAEITLKETEKLREQMWHDL